MNGRSVAILMLCSAGLVAAWGPLDPPNGPITSTYKTLTEVEPRIAVNAENTPGDAGALFKITKSGSYYLPGNITGASGKNGIIITAPQVTLDLCGFTLTGVEGSLDAIDASGFTGTFIRNGHITLWGGKGVDVGNDSRVEDMTVNFCDGDAFDVPYNGVVTRCQARNNGGRGFVVFSDGVVTDCTTRGAGGVGFDLGPNTRIVNSIASDSAGEGFLMAANSSAQGCIATRSGDSGFRVLESATLVDCTANESSGHGFEVIARSRLTRCIARDNLSGFSLVEANSAVECTASSNSTNGVYIAGNANTVERCTLHENSTNGLYLVAGVGNSIDGNLTTYNGSRGVWVVVSDNLIVRNRSRGNPTANYTIDAGSDYGVILTNPGQGFTSSAAWANFAY